jgi:hypothetical protein
MNGLKAVTAWSENTDKNLTQGLNCPFATNLSYMNKFYDQYGVMVSCFGAAPVILTSK